MNETIRKLEEALRSDPERAAKLDAEFRRLMKSGEASLPETYLRAVKTVLGMDISLSEFEKARAEIEELDVEELENVAGGGSDAALGSSDNWCWGDYQCFVAFMHASDRHDSDDACGYDYNCILAYRQEISNETGNYDG